MVETKELAQSIVDQPFNFAFFGVGDKSDLMESLSRSVSDTAATVSVDFAAVPPGFEALGHVILRSALNATESTGVAAKWEHLEASLGPPSIFKSGKLPAKLVIFAKSFDAVRDPSAIEALARIASMERGRVIASIDDVCASILSWNPSQKRRFSFVWREVNTWKAFRPSPSTLNWGQPGFEAEEQDAAASAKHRMAKSSHLSKNQIRMLIIISQRSEELGSAAAASAAAGAMRGPTKRKVSSASALTVKEIASLCKREGLLFVYDKVVEAINDLRSFGFLREAPRPRSSDPSWFLTKLAMEFLESLPEKDDDD